MEHLRHNQTPPLILVDPEPCKEIPRRISATIYGWDCPLLTFIYQGFEHVAHLAMVQTPAGHGHGILGSPCPG